MLTQQVGVEHGGESLPPTAGEEPMESSSGKAEVKQEEAPALDVMPQPGLTTPDTGLDMPGLDVPGLTDTISGMYITRTSGGLGVKRSRHAL